MHSIRVYEPALCCNTGVCGPDVDQALVSFTADLSYLTERGVDITRHNMANDPMAFAGEPTVREFLNVVGSDGLPLTTVDGVTVMTGVYPSREQLLRYAGLDLLTPSEKTQLSVTDVGEDSSCGCGPQGCG